MPSGINGSGQNTQQVLTQQNVTNTDATKQNEGVGKIVQVNKPPVVSLKEIQSNKVPFAGFRTATKVERGTLGAVQNGRTAIAAMGKADGKMDIKGLLGSLKTVQIHLDRLEELGTIERCDMDDVACSFLAVGVEELSNKELLATYQNTLSKDFSDLKDTLISELRKNPQNTDAKGYLCNIMNLEDLVLQETGNRMTRGIAPEEADKITSLTQSHGSNASAMVGVDKHTDKFDMTDRSLNTVAQTSIQGAISEARHSQETDTIAANRHLNPNERKGLGDVLRAATLSINVDEGFFLGEDGPLASLGGPWKNLFHLREEAKTAGDMAQVNGIKSAGYFNKREAVENQLFPNMSNGQPVMAKERPTYAALNVRHLASGGAYQYGCVAIHLKPEVSRRATYVVQDSFYGCKAKITQQKKEDFFTLLPHSPHLSEAAKKAISDPSKPLLAQIKDAMAKIPQDQEITSQQLEPFEYVEDLKYDDQMGLIALAIDVFGDSEKTRANMVDHDHIENLIPQLHGRDLGALAAATTDPHLVSGHLAGCRYIEAQIHGELSLLDDVEEIIFDPAAMFGAPDNNPSGRRWLNAIVKTLNGEGLSQSERDALNEEELARLGAMKKSLGGRTIKCSLRVRNTELEGDYNNRADDFQKGHYDRTALQQLAVDLTTDAKMDKILSGNYQLAGFLHTTNLMTAEQKEAFRAAMIDVANNFESNPASAKATDLSVADIIAKEAMERTFPSSFLSLVEGLKQALPQEQVSALKEQIQTSDTSSSAKFMVGQNMAKTLTSSLQGLMDKTLSPTAFCAQCNEAVSTLQTSFDTLPEGVRGQDLGASALMRNAIMQSFANIDASPEAKQALCDAMNSPEMDAIAHTMASLSDPQTGLANTIDFGHLSNVNTVLSTLRASSAEAQGEIVNRAPTVHPHLISAGNRVRLAEIMPEFASRLEQTYPLFTPFPVAANPAALPQNITDRKAFLVSMLPQYGRHEQPGGYDRGTGYHGRGHICRAFIGAEVMAGIMERRGHTVDRAALTFGIVGHDAGRSQNGDDREEQQSANRTVAAAQNFSGPGSLGAAYATEIERTIVGHQSRTLEGMLLNAADSFEIGRLTDFNFHFLPFMRGATADGHTVEIPEDQALRVQLQKECQQLAVLTDPSAALGPIYKGLTSRLYAASDEETLNIRQSQLRSFEADCRGYVEEIQDLDDATIINRTEDVIRRNPNLFPLMTEFYINTLPVQDPHAVLTRTAAPTADPTAAN